MNTAVDHFNWPDQVRELPHNFEAEQALLGAVLVNNRLMDQVTEYLQPEHFAHPSHQRIYWAIGELIGRGQKASPITLKGAFDQDGGLDSIGGSAYLARLAASASTANAGEYGRLVFELWQRRAAIEIGQRLMDQAYDMDPGRTPKIILEAHDQDLTKLISEGTIGEGPKHISVAIDEALQKIDAAANHSGAVVGVTTGLNALDGLLGGLQPSDLILLAARPSMGKTTLAVCMAISAARAGKGVGFFSLEMGQAQVAMTILAAQTGISASAMKMGRVNTNDFGRLVNASRSMKDLPFWLDDTPSLTVAALRARARSLKRRFGISLIGVDYLQLMRPDTRSSKGRYEDVTDISSGLKGIAKELQVPLVALSQLSRQVEQRTDKRPNLSDLRDSGALEQDADVVMFLYRDEYYLAREKPPPHATSQQRNDWHTAMDACQGQAEIIVAKQRTGPIDTIRTQYEQATSKFSDLPDGAPDQERFL